MKSLPSFGQSGDLWALNTARGLRDEKSAARFGGSSHHASQEAESLGHRLGDRLSAPLEKHQDGLVRAYRASCVGNGEHPDLWWLVLGGQLGLLG